MVRHRRQHHRPRDAALKAGAAAVAAVALLGAGAAYREGPPPGHTGGFGEPHCGACHLQTGSAAGGGAVLEAPEGYAPGRRYLLTVGVRDPELEAGGFQLSARFAGGDRQGRQAGTLESTGQDTQTRTGENGIVYASHTEEGVTPDTTGGQARAAGGSAGARRWTVAWTAPESGGAVAFDLAVNAANDDDSELGDRIYLARRTAGAAREKRRRRPLPRALPGDGPGRPRAPGPAFLPFAGCDSHQGIR